MRLLKQSTAANITVGPFLDSTDGDTEETGLTIAQADIRLSKNGAAWAQTNNATGATHQEKGNYQIPLDTTDTNTLGTLRVYVHVSGALAVWDDFMVLPANVYDSLVSGSDSLEVDATAISGDTTAADNLELFYDGTGYNAANSTIGTCTTNTDMRGTDSAFLAASAPSNFSSLGINASGHISRVVLCDTTTTNTDMRGTDSAFLAASAPANFSTLSINASGHISRVVLCDTVTTLTGHTAQTGDSFARLGAPAGADLAADVAAIKADTAAILLDTGTDGVVVATASKTGYSLASTGLDLVLVGGIAMPTAIDIVAAAAIGIVSGAGSGTEVFKSLDKSTTRATVTVDSSGNRSAITYVS